MELTGEVRKCPRCKRTLSVSLFTVTQRGNISSRCDRCRRYEAKTAQKYRDTENNEQRAQRKQSARDRHRRDRDQMFAAYGGKCSCCGEARPEFLTLDHPDNNGYKERKIMGRGPIAGYLKKMGYPKTYRLQCYNCNLGRAHFGYCPHQVERGEVKADRYRLPDWCVGRKPYPREPAASVN